MVHRYARNKRVVAAVRSHSPLLALAAGMIGLLVAASAPPPALANRGNATGNPNAGNQGRGPIPSRGNAGRNSGVTTPTNTNLAPRVRFAPSSTAAPAR